MKIIVTGGRNYGNSNRVFEALDEIHAKRPITKLIHGGASGADSLGEQWAKSRGVAVVRVPADWSTYGRSARPRRNAEMLVHGPELVVAFPGGRGTASMIGLAKGEGVKVIDYTDELPLRGLPAAIAAARGSTEPPQPRVGY